MAELLISKIAPLASQETARSLQEAFLKELQRSNDIVISVGYVSGPSLLELDRLIQETPDLKHLILVLGMYRIEGMPESIYHTAKKINAKWKESGRGEIRYIAKSLTDHEKVYMFSHRTDLNDPNSAVLHSAIIGSNNLGFIKPQGMTIRQYETAVLLSDALGDSMEQTAEHQSVILKYTDAFEDVKVPLFREENEALHDVQTVTQHTKNETSLYQHSLVGPKFLLPLKVPGEKFKMDKKDDQGKSTFTGSNINVCYAEPRWQKGTNRYLPRDWYEMQMCVGSKIRKIDGYPDPSRPFFIMTDDGYFFKAHTESQNNKQLSAVGNEHIMGRWLKGRLAAAGLVTPVDDPYKNDQQRNSMITKEMLAEYGTDHLLFSKTNQKAADEDGNMLDVWYLSFDPEEVNNE